MPRLSIKDGYPDYNIEVFIPDSNTDAEAMDGSIKEKKEYPVIWLLHGSWGSGSDWFEYTKAAMYAQENGIALVAVNGGNEFYVDPVRGVNWEEVVTRKIWRIIHELLPVSADPAKNAICGLSMGGYGAMKMGLEHPERYSAIGCLSGGVLMPQRYAAGKEPMAKLWRLEDVFGPADQVIGSGYDLRYVAAEAVSGGVRPYIYMCVGTRDVHEKEDSPKFAAYLREIGMELTWDEGDYDHEFRFWDIQLEKFMLCLKQRGF